MSDFPAGIVVRDTLEEVSVAAIDRLTHRAKDAVAVHGVFTLALSGGATPAAMYEQLAVSPQRERLPWGATQLYWGDERCVPPDAAESNYALAWRLLLSRLDLHPEQIHRIVGEDADPAHAAAQYAQILPEALDVLLLGIGEDGHLASLFPGSPVLQEQTRRVVAITDAPKPPPCRITITPPVIAAARCLMVIAAGRGKAAAVTRALTGEWDVQRTPAQLARHGLWYLDAEAAAGLGSNPDNS